MQDHVFRTYDIRGIVGLEFFLDDVYACARAAAFYYKQQDPSLQTIAVGMDERAHSPAIKESLVRAFLDSGINVIFIGVCPTPVLYFSQYVLPVQGALMITASHNPKEYNGIKFCLNKSSVFSSGIETIRTYFKQKKQIEDAVSGIYSEQPLIGQYVVYLKTLFPELMHCSMPMVFDCANGATGSVVPHLIHAMGWENAVCLYSDMQPTTSVHEADPAVEKNMQDVAVKVRAMHAQVGMGFDGDGDRMGAVTETGQYISGDLLLAVWSKDILREHPGASVVFDAKCSGVVQEVVEQEGGKAIVSKSGHAYIKQALHKHQALLGGELSCHYIFNDRYFGYDDGIYASLRLIELLLHSKRGLQALVDELPVRKNSPELRIACAQGMGPQIVESVKKFFDDKPDITVTTVDGVRVDSKQGWGLLRASNTQPVICLRFESKTQEGLQEVKEHFIQALSGHFPDEFLQKQVNW